MTDIEDPLFHSTLEEDTASEAESIASAHMDAEIVKKTPLDKEIEEMDFPQEQNINKENISPKMKPPSFLGR